jgi:hypothetical protein
MSEQFSLSESQAAVSRLFAVTYAFPIKEDKIMDYVIVFATAAMVGFYTLLVRWALAKTWKSTHFINKSRVILVGRIRIGREFD